MNTSPPRQHSSGKRSQRPGLWPTLTFLVLTGSAILTASCGSDLAPELTEQVTSSSYSRLCGLSSPTEESSRLPTPTGSHCVGKTDFSLIDTERTEPFTPENPAVRRELAIKVWYPSSRNSAAARAPYMDSQTLEWLQRALPPPNVVTGMETNSKARATPESGKFPVLLFSPGLGLVTEAYSALLEDLASHGFIVVAINHPYVSGLTILANGRRIEGRQDFDDEGERTAHDVVVADLVSTLDWLTRQNTIGSANPLAGHLDLSRIGAFGHSFGGSASLQLSRKDSRLGAAADMDGSVHGDLSQSWPKPLLMLVSEAHNLVGDPTLEALRQGSGNTKTYAVLAGSGHMDFSDAKLLFGHHLPEHSQDELSGLGLGSITAQQAFMATRSEILGFFEHSLGPCCSR